MKTVTFTSVAQEVQGKYGPEVGVWTDGIGVYSDNEPLCAFPLKSGKTYKVTVEEVSDAVESEVPAVVR